MDLAKLLALFVAIAQEEHGDLSHVVEAVCVKLFEFGQSVTDREHGFYSP